MLRSKLLPLVICFFLVACSGGSAVKNLNGEWAIDIDKTVEKNPALQGNTTGDALAKGLAVTLLKGMKLDFESEKKTVSGTLLGVSFSKENFGVVEDTASFCTLLIAREKMVFTPEGDLLIVTTEAKDTVLVFAKVKK